MNDLLNKLIQFIKNLFIKLNISYILTITGILRLLLVMFINTIAIIIWVNTADASFWAKLNNVLEDDL
jgi:hypothetical protein